MVYSYSKLKGKITERYGTQASFAKKLGISKKLNVEEIDL